MAIDDKDFRPRPQPSSGRTREEMDRELEDMLREGDKARAADLEKAKKQPPPPPPQFKPAFRRIRNLGEY